MNFKKGDLVISNGSRHGSDPRFYPTKGTIGEIITVTPNDCFIQWEKGSTSIKDRWWAEYYQFGLYKMNED